ncbi:DnaD domain protein [Streptococcus gallolyticus]|uniref:DnaD domain-containing protein n=1 Tax=Streptococcus gallolyticus TaxID=315405 RepID=UPI001F3B1641|nr:DnaD domain protein [Streptococcus gallolyticus]MCF1634147.1 DnaD domain protein [Streptococcus gallolyticus]
MAQRRMFSKKITDSDKFLDLPLTAQALYFHLNMHADDDGFVDNTKTIKRMIGASDGDLRILMEQAFVLPFESGVIVIKDWKIHNYIPKDRYQKTVHTTEFSRLTLEENKSYTECIQNVYNLDTQDRIDKDRIGKDKLVVAEVSEPATATEKSNFNVIDYYQERIDDLDDYQLQKLKDYIQIDNLAPELIKRAIDRAADNSKRNFSYVNSILKKWGQNGIKTIVQQDEEQRNFDVKKAQRTYSNRQPAKSNVPEWVDKDYRHEATAEEQAQLEELKASMLENEKGS